MLHLLKMLTLTVCILLFLIQPHFQGQAIPEYCYVAKGSSSGSTLTDPVFSLTPDQGISAPCNSDAMTNTDNCDNCSVVSTKNRQNSRCLNVVELQSQDRNGYLVTFCLGVMYAEDKLSTTIDCFNGCLPYIFVKFFNGIAISVKYAMKIVVYASSKTDLVKANTSPSVQMVLCSSNNAVPCPPGADKSAYTRATLITKCCADGRYFEIPGTLIIPQAATATVDLAAQMSLRFQPDQGSCDNCSAILPGSPLVNGTCSKIGFISSPPDTDDNCISTNKIFFIING